MKTKRVVASLLVAVLGVTLLTSCETENSRREKCANNLRQLGLSLIMYAVENDNILPDKLSDLYPDYVTDINRFICPSAAAKRKGDTVELTKETIDELTDYVYIGAGMNWEESTYDMVAHDKPENHGDEGQHVLFGGGGVAWR